METFTEIRPQADLVESFAIGPDSVAFPVPVGMGVVFLTADVSFYAAFDRAASLPEDGHGSVLNPTARALGGEKTISAVSRHQGYLTVEWYRRR